MHLVDLMVEQHKICGIVLFRVMQSMALYLLLVSWGTIIWCVFCTVVLLIYQYALGATVSNYMWWYTVIYPMFVLGFAPYGFTLPLAVYQRWLERRYKRVVGVLRVLDSACSGN